MTRLTGQVHYSIQLLKNGQALLLLYSYISDNRHRGYSCRSAIESEWWHQVRRWPRCVGFWIKYFVYSFYRPDCVWERCVSGVHTVLCWTFEEQLCGRHSRLIYIRTHVFLIITQTQIQRAGLIKQSYIHVFLYQKC